MKRALNFIVHNRKTILKAIATGIAAIIAYVMAHNVAVSTRVNDAIGGEIFVPFIVILVAYFLWDDEEDEEAE